MWSRVCAWWWAFWRGELAPLEVLQALNVICVDHPAVMRLWLRAHSAMVLRALGARVVHVGATHVTVSLEREYVDGELVAGAR